MKIDKAKIKERIAAASPAPWYAADCISPRILLYMTPGNSADVIELGGCYADGGGKGKANMRFIAHARQDLPALIEENTRLTELLTKTIPSLDFELSDLRKEKRRLSHLNLGLPMHSIDDAIEHIETLLKEIKESI